jgi:hypothetical protein
LATSVEAARQHWAEGNRRLESQASDPAAYARLLGQLEIALEELRKRLGETFSLAQLAEVYDTSDDWMRDAVGERAAAAPDWPRQLATVQDAAFHRFARGATDYAP